MTQSRMRLLITLFLILFWGVVFGKVWIVQWSQQDVYEVGDSAVLHCNLSSQGESVTGCYFFWAILDPSDQTRISDILKEDNYKNRIKIDTHSISTSMTLNDLRVSDMEKLFCEVSCIVDGNLEIISGDGTSLKINEKKPTESMPHWLKYLLFSINLLIFLIATAVCASVIRSRIQKNAARNL